MRHYSDLLRERARSLRKTQTDVEAMMWRLLRSRELAGCKFRRQHPVVGYIADFICLDRKVIVELDGGQHDGNVQYDQARTHRLNEAGFRVLRFWNHQVIESREAVLEAVLAFVNAPHPDPLPASGARECAAHPDPAGGAREMAPHPDPLPAGGARETNPHCANRAREGDACGLRGGYG